jgi:hypothetical protein
MPLQEARDQKPDLRIIIHDQDMSMIIRSLGRLCHPSSRSAPAVGVLASKSRRRIAELGNNL